MSPVYRLITSALTPLIAASCAFALLCGVYVAAAGGVGAVWSVVLGFFLSPLLFPLLILPAAFFSGLMGLSGDRKIPATIFGALAAGWLVMILALWAAYVFDRAAGITEGPAGHAALAWSVSASVAPWAVFARGDRGNVFFTALVLMLLAGCLVAAGTGARDFGGAFTAIAGTMALLAAAQAACEELFSKKNDRLN